MDSSPGFYYVYVVTNCSKTLYTGVTGYLERRVLEHKQGIKGEFAARYKIDRSVYFERFGDVHTAIGREKQIKGLLRIKKIALIVSMNPDWKDLSEGWYVGIAISRKLHRSFVGNPSRSEGLHFLRMTGSYVPSDQPARYSSCSGVSLSILMPTDSSFSLATRLSRSSGTL